MGWRGRGWAGPWPGRGPFSYLPPWQRPCWLFGRGFGRGWWWVYPPAPPRSPEDELAALEYYKKGLEEEKASIEQEIRDAETRIKEQKAMLEQSRGQPPRS